jgi:hypothetical protein
VKQDIPNAEYQHGVLRWMNQMLQEAIAANHQEFSYSKIGEMIDAIMGADEPSIRSPRLSNARINRLQKTALEMRSMLTDIKPFWTYNATARRYEKQAEIFGKLAKNWYLRRGVDQTFCDAIDYVLVAGTGYIHFFWDYDLPGPPDKNGIPTRGDINVRAEDPRDVFIHQHSGDKRSLQTVRGVTIRRERLTRWLKETYPKSAEFIESDRTGFEKESPSQKRARSKMEEVASVSKGPFHESLFGGEPHQTVPGNAPVTDEFTTYIYDWSTNDESYEIEMGEFIDAVDHTGRKIREPKYSWCYTVKPGELKYPFGRRIVYTRHGVLSDGPNHFHGAPIPVCKTTLDTWGWSLMGTSPLQPALSVQRAIDENVRAIQDHIRRVARPGLIYDKNAVPSNVAKKLDMRKDGAKIAHNPHAGKPVTPIHEPALDQTIPEWLKFLLEEMENLAGTASMKQFTQLGQVPSTETIDKIIDSMTPLVRARSRSMEIFIRDFAMILASMFMQFYTLDLRLRILGADGMTFEDWDYYAGDLVPDFIADEDYDDQGNVRREALERGPSPDFIRNREFLRYFSFDIAQGSLLDAATITKKLLYLQLSRMGLIDHWTLLETLQVPNVGAPPDWATTITKRLQAEQLMGLGVIASTVGRPPSAQQMPTLNPDGGISESG